MTNTQFDAILHLDKRAVNLAKALREKSIDDAVVLSGGSRKDLHFHFRWRGTGYAVGVGKPGKETENTTPNLNDMWPFISKEGIFDERSATFQKIFFELEKVGKQYPEVLDLLGCLFVRSAYMLDHEIVDGVVTYVPPNEIMDEIQANGLTMMFDIPLMVFLQYLEMIALNEDVKYQRRLKSDGKKYPPAAGRQNNLLTCAHLVAVLLGRTSIVGFATRFAQARGVSPIQWQQLPVCFPMLTVEISNKKAKLKKVTK